MPGLAFIMTSYNKNSIAALTAAMETDPRTTDLPLYFYRDTDPHLRSTLLHLADQLDHLVVALSFTTPSVPVTRNLLQSLLPLPPNITLIAGGPHPSGDPLGTLAMGIDLVVVGEGEATLPNLLDHLFSGEPVAGLPGTVTMGPHGPIYGPRPPRVDLDAYPPFSIRHRRFAPIEISRGCPWACTYCQTPYMMGGRMRHRSIEAIVSALEEGLQAGYRYARFVTPDAFAYGSIDGKSPNLEALERLLYEVSRRVGRDQTYFGSFPSEVRPENVTPETVALVRKYAANTTIVFGAQSGSPRMLQQIRRGHTVEDVYRATEIALSAGLTPYIDVIFGLPGETEEDRELTRKMIEDLTRMGGVIHTHTFMPLPGTPLADAPPGRVDPNWHTWLDRLAAQGKQCGQWRLQEQLAALKP